MPAAALARRTCASSRREIWRCGFASFLKTRISVVVCTFEALILQARDVTIARVSKGMLNAPHAKQEQTGVRRDCGRLWRLWWLGMQAARGSRTESRLARSG